MRRGSMPREIRKPTQNWWVDQRLSVRGMPMRSSVRDFSLPEGVCANQVGHVRKDIFGFLQLGFHHAHFVDVLEQALRAGVAADDALPAFGERHLAPRA